MKEIINVTKTSMPPYEEYCNEIKDLWDTKWITNMGTKHKSLENSLIDILNVNNVTLFTNGHLALEAAIKSLDLKGEVITTPFTFASTTHAIVRSGLIPVFCDVEPDYYTIDVNKIEKLITPKTCAIIPVHVYGNICNYKAIKEIAVKHNLKIIYDAAHAFYEEIDNINVASLGDISMFSFHATKVFNTIEGGALTYNNDKYKEVLNLEKNFGIPGPGRVVYAGGNAKLNEFQAAMGICNLRHLDSEIKKRELVFERYYENLHNSKALKLCNIQKNVKHNYSYLPVVFKKDNRDDIFDNLKRNGINTRKYFSPLTNEYTCYNFDPSKTPIAKDISHKVLTLPLYSDLAISDVDNICDIILHK